MAEEAEGELPVKAQGKRTIRIYDRTGLLCDYAFRPGVLPEGTVFIEDPYAICEIRVISHYEQGYSMHPDQDDPNRAAVVWHNPRGASHAFIYRENCWPEIIQHLDFFSLLRQIADKLPTAQTEQPQESRVREPQPAATRSPVPNETPFDPNQPFIPQTPVQEPVYRTA